MSLFKIFDIAGSGMSAQAIRLNTTASNIANAESVSSSTEKTYRARQPVFSTVFDNVNGFDQVGGVRVNSIIENQAPLRVQYQPDHPMADDNGNIYMPNVNMIEEMANMISASRSFQSNIEVLNTSKQMLLGTLRLGE
ncbi:MAG: flagellar basal body rod protein FlgC [Gammaproteobacteria bacterium]|nr:flagellar basal body rod protein FlgC [Gammaproteobacteria bacterium]